MTAARQVALVTGASSGIGKAAAIALSAAGFEVIGNGRNTARITAPAGGTRPPCTAAGRPATPTIRHWRTPDVRPQTSN
jgi:NAD(P)-dependent dehydrogenase (short-subunit alcohol dehydrogenase family)